MRMFTNLLYDICTVLSCLNPKESPRDKWKSTDFGAHQRFWDQRYNESVTLLMLKVYSLEQRRIIYFPGMNILLHDEFYPCIQH